ncbi:MAG: hypothetical protein ACTTJZ_00525 [Sphaerochaetaceae bacterium]
MQKLSVKHCFANAVLTTIVLYLITLLFGKNEPWYYFLAFFIVYLCLLLLFGGKLIKMLKRKERTNTGKEE